jgi:hypothetical protein
MKKPDVQQVCQAASFLLCDFLALQIASGLEGTEFSGGELTGPLLSMGTSELLFTSSRLS